MGPEAGPSVGTSGMAQAAVQVEGLALTPRLPPASGGPPPLSRGCSWDATTGPGHAHWLSEAAERPAVLHSSYPVFIFHAMHTAHSCSFIKSCAFSFFFLFKRQRWKAMWLLLLAGTMQAFLHHHMKWSRNLHLRKARSPGLPQSHRPLKLIKGCKD